MRDDDRVVLTVDNGRLSGQAISPEPKLPWGRMASGLAVAMTGTVIATLAATHSTARHENAKAYVHGMNDCLRSIRQSIRDGVDPFDV